MSSFVSAANSDVLVMLSEKKITPPTSPARISLSRLEGTVVPLKE